MKRKRIISAMLILSVAAVLFCAGSASLSSSEKKEVPEEDPETVFIDKSKLPYDTHIDYKVDMGESEDEKEDARLIAYKAITALQERDYFCMTEFLDFDVWYYAQNGSYPKRETLIENLQKTIEEEGLSSMWGIKDGYVYEYGDASIVNCNDILLTEPYQTVLLTPKVYGTFDVSKAYKVDVYATSPDKKVTKSEMYVIKINNAWKLDIALSIDRIYHDLMIYYAVNKA